MTTYTRLLALTLGSVLLGAVSLRAQAPSDALRNASDGLNGTARAQAMGGKIGALGADPTAILTNPAGSALYFKNALSFTMDVNGNFYYPYIDQRQSEAAGSNWSGGIANLSYISGALGKYTSDSGWNIGWGIQYNKDYDFSRKYGINFAEPNSSIAEFMADRANAAGAPWQDYMYDSGTGYDPFMQSGLDPIVTMGMNGGLIENDGTRFTPGAWAWTGAPDASEKFFLAPNMANLTVNESGAKHSFDINLSAGLNSRLFFGASLRLGTSSYNRNSEYTEEFFYEPKNNVIRYTYDNELRVTGHSFGLNLGLLYALGDYGRIGVSYLLPQYASYDELYYASAGSYNDAINGDPNMGFNTGEDYLSSNYSMWLPGKLTLSAMAYLGKWGMITYDFSWQNLASASISGGGDTSAMAGPNTLIDEYYGSRFGNHLGLELRPLSWLSLRAGGSYTTSGIKIQSQNAVMSDEYVASGTILDYTLPKGTYSGSAGLGFQLGSFSADLAYVYQLQKNEVYPYPATSGLGISAEGANMDIDRHSIVGTLTLTF